jgi:hypothetical protein
MRRFASLIYYVYQKKHFKTCPEEERAVWSKTLDSSSKASASSAIPKRKPTHGSVHVHGHHQGHRTAACAPPLLPHGSANQMPAPLHKAAPDQSTQRESFACFGFTPTAQLSPRPLTQSRYKGTATAQLTRRPAITVDQPVSE